MEQKTIKENASLKGIYTFTLRNAVTGAIEWQKTVENIVPTVARTMIANNLTAVSPTNVMKITHAALGTGLATGGGAPANGNTQLATESYRNAIASITNAANIGYATGFFSAAECSGTYTEAGIFSNGTGSANSGVLISRVAVSITKTTAQTLTIDYTLTIN